MTLRDLDARLVPRAAARLRAGVEAVRARRKETRRRVLGVAAPLPAGAEPGLLRRLDDRYATTGPLSLLRRAPGVVVTLLVVLLAAGTLSTVQRAGDGPGGIAASSSQRLLGPAEGASVPEYLERAGAGAVEASRTSPEAPHLALVSLSDYGRPDQVERLLDDVQVVRAYLRPRTVPDAEVRPTDVVDLVDDLRLLCSETARRRTEDRDELLAQVQQLSGGSEQERRAREAASAAADLAAAEAEAYRDGCGCVFTVLVRGTAATLAQLPARRGVRAVELAGPGVDVDEVQVRVLHPEQTDRAVAAAATGPTDVQTGA